MRRWELTTLYTPDGHADATNPMFMDGKPNVKKMKQNISNKKQRFSTENEEMTIPGRAEGSFNVIICDSSKRIKKNQKKKNVAGAPPLSTD